MARKTRTIAVLLVAVIGVSAVAGFGALAGAQDGTNGSNNSSSGGGMQSANVSFANQSTDGTTVTVESVTMSEGGFVAIHDASLLDGNVQGSVIGVSEHLDAGTHENVEVTLFDVPGQDFEDGMSLQEDQTLIAMPHLDSNSNGTYDFITSNASEDGPYTADGEAVVDTAGVTVQQDGGDGKAKDGGTDNGSQAGDGKAKDGGDGAMAGGNGKAKAGDGGSQDGKAKDGGDGAAQPTANVSFADQSSDGTTVTVDSVTMSEGGFVAIHNASLLDGNVQGSVVGVSEHLEAGTHENVEVTLFDVPGQNFEDGMSLSEDGTLIAMPHLDSNSNGSYDFITSNASEDGPYTADGEAVLDSGNVTVEGGA